jgi:hypothetical protein
MDSTAQTATRDSEIIKELLPRVTHGFDSVNTPMATEIINESASMGDAWIQQLSQPLGTHKSSTNFCH